jgi:transcriptional regulator with XRE-family HTH domain
MFETSTAREVYGGRKEDVKPSGGCNRLRHPWGRRSVADMRSTRPKDAIRTAFGTRLRTIREERGLSLETLEERSGVSIGSLSRAENGLQWFNTEKFQAIADALDVHWTSLICPELTPKLRGAVGLLNACEPDELEHVIGILTAMARKKS